MNKIATLALTAAAALALTACGKSDKASEGAQADNVEMPAEEAVNGADEGATPLPETDVPTDAAAPAAPDAAAPAAAPTAAPATTAAPAGAAGKQ